jgi:hypothetical protein
MVNKKPRNGFLKKEFLLIEDLEKNENEELVNFINTLNEDGISKNKTFKERFDSENKQKVISMEDIEKNENEELLKFMDTLNEDCLISKNKTSKELFNSNKKEELKTMEDFEKTDNEELLFNYYRLRMV